MQRGIRRKEIFTNQNDYYVFLTMLGISDDKLTARDRTLSYFKKQVCSILENHSLKRAYEILQKCEDDDIQMMTIKDAIYPDRAIIDEKSPILLYYKGIVREMDLISVIKASI